MVQIVFYEWSMYMYAYFFYISLCLHVSDSRSFGQRLHGADNMFAPKKGVSFPTRLYIYCHWKSYNRRYGWCPEGPIMSPGIITNWKIFGNEIGISLNMSSQTLSPTESAQPVSLRKDCRWIRLTSLECPKVQADVSFRMTPVIASPPAAPFFSV